jgi:hypothetical protein
MRKRLDRVADSSLLLILNRFAALNSPARETHQFLTNSVLPLNVLLPYLFVSTGRHTRNLIHKTPEFELMLVAWPPGTAALYMATRERSVGRPWKESRVFPADMQLRESISLSIKKSHKLCTAVVFDFARLKTSLGRVVSKYLLF